MTNINEDEMLDSKIKSRLLTKKINEPDFNARFFKSDTTLITDEEVESEEE